MADEADEQARIYRDRAEAYDALIRHEDHQGALLAEIERIVPLVGAELLDVGAGTGRISLLLAGRAKRLVLVERAPAMLAVARRKLAERRVVAELHEADAREMPLAEASFDVAIAGWVFGHFRHWMPEGWRTEVQRAVGEMSRVVRPGGHLVVIETLGPSGAARAPGPRRVLPRALGARLRTSLDPDRLPLRERGGGGGDLWQLLRAGARRAHRARALADRSGVHGGLLPRAALTPATPSLTDRRRFWSARSASRAAAPRGRRARASPRGPRLR